MKLKLAFSIAIALVASFAAANEDLIINRVFLRSPNEAFEIKNVGAGTIDLGAQHIALVGISNLHPSKGKIDFWYEFTGLIASGETMCVRAKTGSGAPPDIEVPFATPNGDVIRTTFKGFTLPANGDNFILVRGFHAIAVNPRTHAAYAFLDKLDEDGDYYLDFLSTPSKADDLWDSALDALTVAPDMKAYPAGWDNYALGLDLPHSVAGLSNPDWTGTYFLRLQNQDTGQYDEVLQMDTLPKDAKDQILGGEHRGLISQHAYTLSGYGRAPAKVRFYAGYAVTGNITDWDNFTGLSVGGHVYVH